LSCCDTIENLNYYSALLSCCDTIENLNYYSALLNCCDTVENSKNLNYVNLNLFDDLVTRLILSYYSLYNDFAHHDNLVTH